MITAFVDAIIAVGPLDVVGADEPPDPEHAKRAVPKTKFSTIRMVFMNRP